MAELAPELVRLTSAEQGGSRARPSTPVWPGPSQDWPLEGVPRGKAAVFQGP